MSYKYNSRNQRKSNSAYSSSRGSYNNRRSNNSRKVKHGQYIDPSRFVQIATASENEAYVSTHTFADFKLDSRINNNLVDKGYKIPSPIQDQAIPVAMNGQDVVGIASTGTGKTAAFALPLLHKLLKDQNSSALIIAPTRELAQQIENECRNFIRGTGLRTVLIIGGSSMGYQIRGLQSRPRIVIGTPGRLKDHIQRGTLQLKKFNTVVLDEVDRMLDMGFVDDVRHILSHAAEERQSLFFSATIDGKVSTLIDTFTNNPVTISIKPSATSENIHQDVVRYQTTADKIEKLHDVLNKTDVTKVIIFDETQRSVERLHRELNERGFTTESIHGGRSQGQRKRAMDKFKDNQVSILVATDVAARGIDVADISHVVNYSVPKVYDDYIHRIGRAGRAGQVGYALTFVSH